MKKIPKVLTIIAVFTTIAIIVMFSIHIARAHTINNEKEHMALYARDVLYRFNAMEDQVNIGFKRLAARKSGNPCSLSNIERMREIDIASKYLRAFGHVSGERITCSSLSGIDSRIELGPVNTIDSNGILLRTDVHFPFAPENSFLVFERDGYAAIVPKDLPIDVTTEENGVVLGAFSLASGKILAARGPVNPVWVNALYGKDEAVFTDGRYLVAVLKSDRYQIGSIAALPLWVLDEKTSSAAFWIVPVGVLTGIVLAAAGIYLARHSQSFPTALRSALRRKEIFVMYQPVVNLQTRKWVGAEALVRWQRKDGKVIQPNIFIPVAETTGLIPKITERVIEIVGKDGAEIFQNYPNFHIAINLSAGDLQSPRTIDLLRDLIRHTNAGPENLIVEVTERGFLLFESAREIVRDIRSTGIRTSIDDFGTGYSSLSCLEKLEIDFLKIDKSFVDTIGKDAPTSQVVLHIIELAKDINLEMIAEGVESEEQAQFLYDLGVKYAQGWLFGKPMSIKNLEQAMEHQQNKEFSLWPADLRYEEAL